MIKSKLITKLFQKYLIDKDIRIFKKSFLYYLIFRVVRNFLEKDIIINIYDFKIFGSIKKNNTSYFLLKKCEFGDNDEMNTLEKFSKYQKILLIDCGCNYGFYSFHVASISKENRVLSIEASEKTSNFFLKNHKLNKFENIIFHNYAISDVDNKEVQFNESDNDWESSLTHDDFKSKITTKVKTRKIDTLIKDYELNEFIIFIKLDIEGNEVPALQGGSNTIKEFSPIIIIEFSKFIFNNKKNIDYINNFLLKFDYKIFDTKKNEIDIEEILSKIKLLTKRHKTIGNYYLIKKNSKQLNLFLKND